MVNFRRTSTALGAAVVLSAALATLLGTPGLALGQMVPKQPVDPPVKTDYDKVWSAIKLVENTQYQEWINVAHDCIDTKAWNRAVIFLQNILDSKEDFYAEITRRDPVTKVEKVRSVSVKIEANQLISAMPDEGLNVYEVKWGGKAKDLLDTAKKKGDRELLAEVAQRFMNTRAGTEANELLATYFLDRGLFFKASLHFERLLALRESRTKISDLVLFKAVLAHRRAGDTANADTAWKRLLKRIQPAGGLKVGDEVVAIKTLEDVLKDIPQPVALNPHDRPWVGGNLTNTAQSRGSPPLLDEVPWWRATVLDNSGNEPDPGPEAEKWLKIALDTYRQRAAAPVMSGAFPIASSGKLFYRTYAGIAAVYLNEVKETDGTVSKPGDIFWKSTPFEGSLGVILSEQHVRPNVDDWLRNTYQSSGFINLVYENSMVGTLSTDHRFVYAVDDLAVPIPPGFLQSQFRPQPNQYSDQARHLVMQNNLQAFDLETGKLEWRVGSTSRDKSDLFDKSHFLGAPLPVGGKLYVLNEQNDGTLRLVCLDPLNKGALIGQPQTLGVVGKDYRVVYDISRRSTAVHLAYGEGILVCPTNAGHVFGIDLLTRSLAWAYPYRQSAPDPRSSPISPNQFGNRSMALSYDNWKVSPPVVQDGKVVFTAPDAKHVHCINLRDGLPAWTHLRQDNDLFLAGVIKDQVLIVGKNSVRFLRLSDGATLGSLATGDVPSGQGVASNDVYYLPLSKGEILAIDVPRRIIKAHNRSGKEVNEQNPAPGNLVFYEGAVLSQTPTRLVAYPQLTAKLNLARAALEKDPKSLDKRFARGELLLADGQVQQAVDDLRTVRDAKPEQALADKVNLKLYEALTTLLQADFANASVKYLDEYEALCKLPAGDDDRQRRQALLLRILGQGRESQGDLVAAFKAYRQFGSLPLFKTEGVPSLEDPLYKIPTGVWLRGRIGAMFANAPPAQREALEKQIDVEWQQVSVRNQIDELRGFANMFDVPFKVGRSARLQLATSILDQKQPAYLEAELALQQLRVGQYRTDPQLGGLALEMLARLEKRKAGDDALKQAAAYYRQLSEEFANVVVRDGKTGQDLFNELTNDKRVLPHLQEDTVLWAKADMKHRITNTAGILSPRGFTLYPAGDVSPFLKQHRLLVDNATGEPVLQLIHSTTGKEAWRIGLGNEPRNAHFYGYLQFQADRNAGFHPNARFRFYQARGHLAVVQLGIMVYGVDTGAGKLLWNYCVLDTQPQPLNVQIMTDQQNPNSDGTLWYLINNTQGQPTVKTRIGHVGAVEASYVALTTQKGLVVLDPLRGTILWTKLSVPPQTEVFGDEQHIYLVETAPNGTVSGPGRALRAVDGEAVEVKEFGHLYRQRLRVLGRNLLVADTSAGLTIRLYDVLEGKDLFKKEFDNGAVVCETEDPYLAGVIDSKGTLTVMDLRSRKEVCQSNLVQGRVTPEVIKNLRKPVLLSDGTNFFVALNQPIDNAKVAGGVVSSNFNNGLRCHLVNGWFCCVSAKGEFLYHLSEELHNQMIVVEQFRSLPVLIFSSRYTRPFNQFQPNPGGQQNVWQTAVFGKANEGRAIHLPDKQELNNNGVAKFSAFVVDVKGGTINLIGGPNAANVVEQIYIDDGKKEVGMAPAQQPGVQGQPPAVIEVVPVQNPKIKLKFQR